MDPEKDSKVKEKYNAGKMSLEDVEKMLQKHNEMHPDNSLGAGVFQCMAELATEIAEKEKERCELTNNQNCIAMINHVNVNEIKAQTQENKELIDEYNKSYAEHNKFHTEAHEHAKWLLDDKDEMEDKHDKLSRELEQAHDKYKKLLHNFNEVIDMCKDLKNKSEKEKKARVKKEHTRNRSRHWS